MKGHLRERSPGRWAIVLDIHDPATGKRKRRWHSFAGSKRQAQVECARLISEIQGGTYLPPSKTTVAEYLDRWLAHMKSQVSPKSYERYGEICRCNIVPLLGGTVLTKLQPIAISDAYARGLASGRSDGKGGLAPRTVHHIHTVLKHALAQAVKWQLLPRNPADAVDPPKIERSTMTTYDIPQTATLIEAVRGGPMFVPVLLAVTCGLRRGEIAALRWRGVDLDKASLAVVESAEQLNSAVRLKEPKSGRARTVALPAMVVTELRAHRLRQAEQLLRLGVRQGDDDFVCGLADGSMMRPNTLSSQWARLVADLKLSRLRFHDLRHTHATALLSSGVHPKVASERLGHSKVGITLDLYSHVLPGMQEDAAAKIDSALQAALKKQS